MRDTAGAPPMEMISSQPGGAVQASPVERDLEDALLAALASMAVRSHRRQADLAVATRRASLIAEPSSLRIALLRLHQDGCIDSIVPLADGGVLLSVTSRGIDRLGSTSRRHAVTVDDGAPGGR